MLDLFPHIEPYEYGLLEVDNIHKIYWEKSGNKKGIPVLVLHGGPGAGGNIYLRRFFDPKYYNIIIFDQRGAGRSMPSACIDNNTTQDLILDIEKLRIFFKINKWIVFGGSWGSSLSLAYSQEYPDNVLSIVLRGIFLCRKKEVAWFLHGIKNIFPEYWNRFNSFLPQEERKELLLSYYKRLINTDPKINGEAAVSWARYEANCSTLLPNASVSEEFINIQMALSLARLEAHYFMNNLFLEEGQLLNNINNIINIKGYIVQGRYDVICPPESAYDLANVWPNSTLKIIEQAGHSSLEVPIQKALLETMNIIKKNS
ncbi:MAG: prolyl aminopeptidase [Alphaproteobacteria bacterium]|jgi:proline iminopeptidase|nr:prolyl aminopeptidase [Alphaproteobacteria bacterium]